MYMLKCVLDKGAPVEQLIVTTIIWRLVANCYKAKHTFRCGSVLSSLWSLKDRIVSFPYVVHIKENDEQREVAMMIDALRLIFDK